MNLDNPLIIIQKSNVHGLGAFAKKNILNNTKLCDYIGTEMKWKDFKEKYGDYKKNSLNTYPMRRIWKIIVAKEEPYLSNNIVNYINEDIQSPNCILKSRALYSIREIQQNEELFLKYPVDYNRYWLQ
jgi:SET domain-containing protein